MAIEDGVLLAELLAKHEAYQDAFAEFMRRRFDRVKCVVEASNQLADWELEAWRGHPNPEARPGELNYETTMMLMRDY